MLTPRQVSILKAIIEEYIDTATAVGSEPLERKYSLGVSPATIRNEMAILVQNGYLKQPHTSAGRLPTAMAMRFYINELMQQSKLSVAEEVATREKIWEYRSDLYRLLQESARTLANHMQTVSLVSVYSGPTFSAGYAHLLSMPEFYDIDVTRQVMLMVDGNPSWLQQLFQHGMSGHAIQLIFGEELNQPLLEPIGMAFSHFQIGDRVQGVIGVVGPARLDFRRTIPIVQLYSHLLEDIGRDW